MEKYQIIPRKFRPTRFDEVAGHQAIVATLKNAITLNRVGQAYLFCGLRGSGKTTLARLLAKALNCAQLDDDQEPCNTCKNCKEIAQGHSLDVIEIDGASNRGIDDIRGLNETVGYAPSQGRYKIYIIDEVHMLTKEAFNALLKTLEEPPATVKFFFATTEPHKIPPTILSRCQRFNLGRVDETSLVAKLVEICEKLEVAIEKEALIQISHLSEGSLRDAQSLLDQLICYGQSPITLDLTRKIFGLMGYDSLFALDDAILAHNTESALLLAQELYTSGRDLHALMDSLLEHYRTYLMVALGQNTPEAYLKRKDRFSKERSLVLLDKLIEWQQSLLKIPFKQIHLEMLFLDLLRSHQKIPLESLVQRLIDLEHHFNGESSVEQVVKIEEPKVEVKAMPVEEPKKETAQIEEPKKEEKQTEAHHPSHYDTLLRFAAIELEGSL